MAQAHVHSEQVRMQRSEGQASPQLRGQRSETDRRTDSPTGGGGESDGCWEGEAHIARACRCRPLCHAPMN